MIYGAILAGGTGKRMQRYEIPKQFITIGGVPIIIMTIREFLNNSRIDKIYVAVHNEWITYAEKLFLRNFLEHELKRIKIVHGGNERIDSFINIMEDIVKQNGINEEDILICHDSVRPFVQQYMINDCIDATLEDKLALTVIPVSDTIHIAHDSDFIDGTLNRENMYNGQTPSGFNIQMLYDACKKTSEKDKHNVTGTTQLMLQLGNKIRIVNGHTSNFKITTDNDLDVANRIVSNKKRTKEISLLDCTLRDGGIVINFDFGDSRMQIIKQCLEASGINIIECGYVNEKTGRSKNSSCYDNLESVKENFLLSGKKEGVTYVAMIDYGTFNFDNLSNYDSKGIDGIRLAFHKENWKEAIECGKKVLEKGYQLFIQPMVTMRYSDDEFRDLIMYCNREIPEATAFYLVDSFGQMDNISLLHKLEIADEYVLHNIKIGFHAHNNRQLAFSNTCALIDAPVKHELIIDSCIMGMGKGAGNLCTELIIPMLEKEGKRYSTVYIYEEINRYFAEIAKKYTWGYCLDYYLSSLYGCTPSYIKIFVQDERVTTDVLVKLLTNMPDEKKYACDREFAQNYLESYFMGQGDTK